MFEKFTGEGARDFRQRYQGSYGFFRKGGKRHLVRLTDINSDHSPPFIRFTDKNGESYSLNADAQDDVGFEFLPPRSCWRNTPTYGAILSRRIATRQWIRGVHDSNTAFVIPRIKNLNVTFQILEELFLAEAPDFLATTEAMLKAGLQRYVALNESFAVGPFGEILLFDTAVASFTKKEDEFVVKLFDSKLFGVEIKDAFTRNNLKVVFE